MTASPSPGRSPNTCTTRFGAKTLFATHYHELAALAATHPRIRNVSVAAREWKGEVVFLRKLVPGGTSRSFGVEVAKLAGSTGCRRRPRRGHPQLAGGERWGQAVARRAAPRRRSGPAGGCSGRAGCRPCRYASARRPARRAGTAQRGGRGRPLAAGDRSRRTVAARRPLSSGRVEKKVDSLPSSLSSGSNWVRQRPERRRARHRRRSALAMALGGAGAGHPGGRACRGRSPHHHQPAPPTPPAPRQARSKKTKVPPPERARWSCFAVNSSETLPLRLRDAQGAARCKGCNGASITAALPLHQDAAHHESAAGELALPGRAPLAGTARGDRLGLSPSLPWPRTRTARTCRVWPAISGWRGSRHGAARLPAQRLSRRSGSATTRTRRSCTSTCARTGRRSGSTTRVRASGPSTRRTPDRDLKNGRAEPTSRPKSTAPGPTRRPRCATTQSRRRAAPRRPTREQSDGQAVESTGEILCSASGFPVRRRTATARRAPNGYRGGSR